MNRYFNAAKSRTSVTCQALKSKAANLKQWLTPADISFFHEFSPPPAGGGHQFMRALWDELQRRGLRLENNTISRTTRACLYNSFNFDFDRLKQSQRVGCRMVHRVDGPIQIYRDWDNGTDRRIWQINQKLADVTVFQSHYSLQKHLQLGLVFKSPQVIMNAANPAIFHAQGRLLFCRDRKIRLLSSSWSDNPNKGFAIYKWLEEHLDWQRFDYTFVGRTPIQFDKIRTLPPVTSEKLANLLRQHDIYISASKHECCSNSLIEALACGMVTLYIDSGSNAEIVAGAGLSFCHHEEISSTLNLLIENYEFHQAQISLPTLQEVGDRYLQVMGLSA
ncbi:glycosyltransferase family 4 protein [bacterium]|nr:glycosyltransferase family 4 protein [bacterium]